MIKKTVFTLAALSLLLGLSFFSCSTKSGTQAQHKVHIPDDPAAKEVHSLLNDDIGNSYQSSDNGEVDLEERSFVKIESQGENTFRHYEVYNVYESDGGIREYYISEFLIDVQDSTNRQRIKDYQLVINGDTVSEAEGNDYEFLIGLSKRLSLGEQNYDLYLLSNFGHIGAEKPDQYSVWSPSCGIVLSWFGEERWFELSQSDSLEEEALALMKENGKKMIQEFSDGLDHSGHDHDH